KASSLPTYWQRHTNGVKRSISMRRLPELSRSCNNEQHRAGFQQTISAGAALFRETAQCQAYLSAWRREYELRAEACSTGLAPDSAVAGVERDTSGSRPGSGSLVQCVFAGSR